MIVIVNYVYNRPILLQICPELAGWDHSYSDLQNLFERTMWALRLRWMVSLNPISCIPWSVETIAFTIRTFYVIVSLIKSDTYMTFKSIRFQYIKNGMRCKRWNICSDFTGLECVSYNYIQLRDVTACIHYEICS
jgi:hypothetical protein